MLRHPTALRRGSSAPERSPEWGRRGSYQPTISEGSRPQPDHVVRLAVALADLPVEGAVLLGRTGHRVVRAQRLADADVGLASDDDAPAADRQHLDRALVCSPLDRRDLLSDRPLPAGVVHRGAVAVVPGHLPLELLD
jgi:hypothetical protein